LKGIGNGDFGYLAASCVLCATGEKVRRLRRLLFSSIIPLRACEGLSVWVDSESFFGDGYTIVGVFPSVVGHWIYNNDLKN
jgi:hypothetical protein